MTGRDLVKILSPLFFETAKLDELVAHHVRVGCQSPFDRLDGVADHLIPVFVMQRDLFETTPVFLGDIGCDLNVLFGRTIDVTILILHANADIENGRIVTGLLQLINHYGAVNASGYQCCYFHKYRYICSKYIMYRSEFINQTS